MKTKQIIEAEHLMKEFRKFLGSALYYLGLALILVAIIGIVKGI